MPRGHICQHCGSINTRVQSTRQSKSGVTTRIRKCNDCNRQLFTAEFPVTADQVTCFKCHYHAKPDVVEPVTRFLEKNAQYYLAQRTQPS